MAATLQPAPHRDLEPRLAATVSLVDADPDLTAGVPDDDLELAHRVLTRPRYDIPKGSWSPELLGGHDDGGFGILVVDGAIVRQLDLGDRRSTTIFGPGDVFQARPEQGLLEAPVSWTALQPSAVVVLDARFTRATQRWPQIGVNLQRRLLGQADRIAVHAAISQLPRVERRVLALFWQLAERWGRVTPFGIEVPLQLTHEAIGRLAGAQRPTVSLALAALGDEGALTRGTHGAWLLARDSRDALGWAAPVHASSG